MTACISYFAEDVSFKLATPGLTTAWIQEVIQQEHYKLIHINFIFCSDAFLHDKNLQYLQHDTLTDVITFNYSETNQALEGDIYISIDRVRDNAITYNQDFWQELYTVMIHGVLHLIGYHDATTTEKAQMRQKEKLYIATRLAKENS